LPLPATFHQSRRQAGLGDSTWRGFWQIANVRRRLPSALVKRIVVALSGWPFQITSSVPTHHFVTKSFDDDLMSQRLNPHRLQGLILIVLAALLLLGGSAANASASEDLPIQELGADRCFMFSLLLPHKMEGNQSIALPLEVIINNKDLPAYHRASANLRRR
jgi:hypothetical protein